MFKKILVPTDGSTLSEKAINAALELASEIGASVVAVSVAEPYPYMIPVSGGIITEPNVAREDLLAMNDAYVHRLAEENVQAVVVAAQSLGVTCEAKTATSAKPHEEIIKAIDEFNCDVVFMASHGHKGISKLFLGSETQKVLSGADVPVMVFR